ncbi:MAG: nucleotidyl transferase AbiEii/AbiGii toxin family protein [Planctomycetota bacterium]|nr:nucleotidyl transferase AbiEii/AbiGii toxin family protein [Planctomycetota bacterium]
MNRFEQFDLPRRRAFCDSASDALGLSPESIEKDFWICWTLRSLFALPNLGADLTFKGGTSLSKGWKLIERFSEDVDVVIDRHTLGLDSNSMPDAAGISANERVRRLEQLRVAAAGRVAERVLPALVEKAANEIVDGRLWQVTLDPGDKDRQSVLLTYPSAFTGASYIRRVVKVEFGARSDIEPRQSVSIHSYLSEALGDRVVAPEFRVQAIEPVRTLWEKAMLLHELRQRESDRPLKGRLSRHYYDLACLVQRGVGELALADPALFERIAAHRRVFFAYGKGVQDSLRLGSLQLLPREVKLQEWRRDYDEMRESMFFTEPPPFDRILEVVAAFEVRANSSVG